MFFVPYLIPPPRARPCSSGFRRSPFAEDFHSPAQRALPVRALRLGVRWLDTAFLRGGLTPQCRSSCRCLPFWISPFGVCFGFAVSLVFLRLSVWPLVSDFAFSPFIRSPPTIPHHVHQYHPMPILHRPKYGPSRPDLTITHMRPNHHDRLAFHLSIPLSHFSG